MSRSSLRVVGIVFWIAAAAVAALAINAPRKHSPAGQTSAIRYLASRMERIEVVDTNNWIQVNDPVFVRAEGGDWYQAGHMEASSSDDPQRLVMAWYAHDLPGAPCRLTAYRNRGQLGEVIQIMFPPEKRRQIQVRLEQAFEQHGDELMQSILPLVQQSLEESMPAIEAEFREAVEHNRDDIDRLLSRWNEELIDQRLIPLARREVMPIVRQHGQPLAETIGRELWDRASLWRFGWRAAYDRSPLPQRDLLQQEWDRFVEDEAIPVFERHMDEVVDVVQRTLADIVANRAVTDELTEVARSLAVDPEAQRLLQAVLRESIVENPRLHQVWREVWNSPAAERARELAGEKLEPVVRQIGDDLFGTPEQGINPDFARVLRNQILGKDRRWIVATPIPSDEINSPRTIWTSGETMPYPLVYLADVRDDVRDDVGGAP